MNQDEFLHRASSLGKHTPVRPNTLGACVKTYLNRKAPGLKKSAAVVDIWYQVLPSELYEHCELVGISRGLLRVAVEPGPYIHEMRLLSHDLLGHLQNRCPGAGIKKIKLELNKESQTRTRTQT